MRASIEHTELLTEVIFKDIPFHIKSLFENTKYPWEVLPKINNYILDLININSADFIKHSDGVWIGKDTYIAPTAIIIAPCILGSECEIRPGAYIRGNVIAGNRCIIGNSTELKNSVLFDNVQLPHYNYVGDSVIGNNSHMGAGAVCSNFKQDKSIVSVKCSETIDTGLRKFGSVISDNVEIGCGCVLNPGTIVLQNSRVYPLTSVRGVVPSNSIMKSSDEIFSIKNTKLP